MTFHYLNILFNPFFQIQTNTLSSLLEFYLNVLPIITYFLFLKIKQILNLIEILFYFLQTNPLIDPFQHEFLVYFVLKHHLSKLIYWWNPFQIDLNYIMFLKQPWCKLTILFQLVLYIPGQIYFRVEILQHLFHFLAIFNRLKQTLLSQLILQFLSTTHILIILFPYLSTVLLTQPFLSIDLIVQIILRPINSKYSQRLHTVLFVNMVIIHRIEKPIKNYILIIAGLHFLDNYVHPVTIFLKFLQIHHFVASPFLKLQTQLGLTSTRRPHHKTYTFIDSLSELLPIHDLNHLVFLALFKYELLLLIVLFDLIVNNVSNIISIRLFLFLFFLGKEPIQIDVLI